MKVEVSRGRVIEAISFGCGDGPDIVVSGIKDDAACRASLVVPKGAEAQRVPVPLGLVIAEGFKLQSVDSVAVALQPAPTAGDQADSNFWASKCSSSVETALKAAAGEAALLVFERPSPPLPPHGWARKALRREPKTRFTTEQRAFLDKHFESSLKGGERMRDKKVLQLMKAEFGRRRGEDGRSLVLAVTDPGLL